MKKLIKVLCVFMFSIIVFAVIAKADHLSSLAKQKELNSTVLELLEEDALDQLEQYIKGIPDCVISEDLTKPEVCTFDNIDGKDFTVNVFLQRGFRLEYKDFTIVSPDVALYEALKYIYASSYNKNPKMLDIENYKKFYNHYKYTWLNDRVEKIIVKIWQHGDDLTKYSNFSCVNGEDIYTTIYLSKVLGFSSMYKYSSPEISFVLTLDAGRGRLHTILNEMKRKSDETDSNDLLKEILGDWFKSLISSEVWDKTEQEFYQGTKQKRMYDMFNERGWDMFAQLGLTPTEWQKHTVTLYAKSCRRVIGNEKKCSAFEEGAIKYGFYEASPAKKVEEKVKEKIEKKIEQEIEEKIEKEMDDKIEEKIFAEQLDDMLARRTGRLDKGHFPF